MKDSQIDFVCPAPVAAARAAGTPIVALESTLISHGLPHPENIEVARGAEAAVRANALREAQRAKSSRLLSAAQLQQITVAIATAREREMAKARAAAAKATTQRRPTAT